MSSNKKKVQGLRPTMSQGPRPTLNPSMTGFMPDLSNDLSSENSALVTYHGNNIAAIVTYDEQKSSPERKPNHKDKYSIASSHWAVPTHSSPTRPTLSTPLQITNSFSPLKLDSLSFKTIASSHISPHSVKQDKMIEKQKSYVV